MRYADGNAAMIGDEVEVDCCDSGVVVALLADGIFSIDHPRTKWGSLKNGLLYVSDATGVTQIEDISSVRLRRRTDKQRRENSAA
jgi:hypothetical protein